MLERFNRDRDSDALVGDARSERLQAAAERRAEEISIRARLQAFRQEEAIKALADVTTTAVEEEMAFYDYGMNLAGGSNVKQELVLQKLMQMSAAKATEKLPPFAPYLRARYDLTDEQVAELESHFQALTKKVAKKRGRG